MITKADVEQLQADIDTLTGQILPEGVLCLLSLFVTPCQSFFDLASLCRMDERTFNKNIAPKLYKHKYADSDGLHCLINTKGLNTIRELFQAIGYVVLGTAETSTGNATASILLAAGSATDVSATDLQPMLPLLADYMTALQEQTSGSAAEEGLQNPVRNAHNDLDQIRSIDLDQLDLIRSDEMRAEICAPQPEPQIQPPAPAASEQGQSKTLEQLLDDWKVTDPKRGEILKSAWCTAERFNVALDLAEANPKRTSPSPIGLALYMLTTPKGRVAIDREIAATRSSTCSSGTGGGWEVGLSDPTFEKIKVNLQQQYGNLYADINPRLVLSDEHPRRWVVLVKSDRTELRATIARLAQALTRKQIQIQIVTGWPPVGARSPRPSQPQGTSHARSTNAHAQASNSSIPARQSGYTASDHDVAERIRARQAAVR